MSHVQLRMMSVVLNAEILYQSTFIPSVPFKNDTVKAVKDKQVAFYTLYDEDINQKKRILEVR